MAEQAETLTDVQRAAADYIDDMVGQLAEIAQTHGLTGQAALLRAYRLAWPTDFGDAAG